MILDTIFQISVSVFCILSTMLMITLFVWSIMLRGRLTKLIEKLEHMLEIVETIANDAKNFTERTIESVEEFKKNIFKFEFVRRIVTETIEFIKNNMKGSKDGKRK